MVDKPKSLVEPSTNNSKQSLPIIRLDIYRKACAHERLRLLLGHQPDFEDTYNRLKDFDDERENDLLH